MEYWILKHQVGTRETGDIFPQISFENQKEAFKFLANEFPSTEVALSAFLSEEARVTDILSQASISGHGLIISEAVSEMLNKFRIMEHREYVCFVKDSQSGIHSYKWLSLVQLSLFDFVDFKRSQFYLKRGLRNMEEISLSNYSDYLSQKAEMDISTIILSKVIRMNPIDLDLFILPLFDNNIYISSRLRKEMENLTGIYFTENSQLVFSDGGA